MPSLGGATGWLNSESLGRAELRGRVVLVELVACSRKAAMLLRRTTRRESGTRYAQAGWWTTDRGREVTRKQEVSPTSKW